MADVEELVRSAFGDLPNDPDARRRALVRLRADIAGTRREGKLDIRSTKLASPRFAPLVLAVAALLLFALIETGGPTPAAAAGLERMAALNAAAPAVHSIDTEEQRSVTQTYLGQGSFTLVVRSSVERSVRPDGTITQTETYEDVEFASDADRSIWTSLGSPDIPKAGNSVTQRFGPSDQDWFDPTQVSTDPGTLLDKLESGKVASNWQGQSGMFVLIGALLADPRLSRAQRAAVFQVAASVDGVKAEGSITDPLGRQGDGYSLVANGRQETLIFDPANGRPLAAYDEAVGSPAGAIGDWMAFEYP